MKKYFVLYHASNEAIEKMQKDWSGQASSPEEQKESMEAWMAWSLYYLVNCVQHHLKKSDEGLLSYNLLKQQTFISCSFY